MMVRSRISRPGVGNYYQKRTKTQKMLSVPSDTEFLFAWMYFKYIVGILGLTIAWYQYYNLIYFFS